MMVPLFKTIGSAIAVTAMLGAAAAMAQSDITVEFADDAWNGETIPEGEHCSLQDGSGSTPALELSGVPEGTTDIHVAYSDESYEPMNDGGHGTIGFAVEPEDGTVSLPSVPGETADLPEPAYIAAPNETSGDFLTEGYMPPCSGGQGNTYSAVVSALDEEGAVLAESYIELGTY